MANYDAPPTASSYAHTHAAANRHSETYGNSSADRHSETHGNSETDRHSAADRDSEPRWVALVLACVTC